MRSGDVTTGRWAAFMVSASVMACAAYPSAHADPIYGSGTYAVPGQLPYGIYVARGEPGDHSAACTFSTWTSDATLISADSGTQADVVVARIQAPAVAKFITRGCTPWTRVG